jgi:hypothetical protein
MKKVISMLLFASLASLDIAQTNGDNPKLGAMILTEQVDDIKAHGGKVDCSNYWNIAVAYKHLGGPKDSIYNNLYKSMEDNPTKFTELVGFAIQYSENDMKQVGFYKILGSRFSDLVKQGKERAATQINNEPEITNIINQTVVDTLLAMMALDQKYRSDPNFTKDKRIQRQQYILDSINTKNLYKLYQVHGYPGKSITGDNEYQDYFCLMVEHGQNKSGEQRFWLPIIAAAFKKQELHPGIFKMLLDRIHWLETGKQYFGSHVGIPLDSDENIGTIKKQYGI